MLHGLQSRVWNACQQKPGTNSRPRLNPFHPCNQGLVGYWLINERGTDQLYNLVDHVPATLNGPTWDNLTVARGPGLWFDGSGDYVDCNGSYNAVANSPVTIIVLFAVYGVPLSFLRIVSNFTGVPRYGFELLTDNALNKTFYFQAAYNGTVKTAVAPDNSIATDEALEVALTYDNASISPVLYKNGVSVAVNCRDGNWAAGCLAASSSNLNLGRRSGSADQYWYGWIGRVELFNRVLSQSEIMEIYEHPFGTPTNPRLIVHPLWSPWLLEREGNFWPVLLRMLNQ